MNTMNKHKPIVTTNTPAKQKGVVLVVSLLFLIIVTMIATTGMENTILEERMAGNLEDYSLAFQAAEAALDEAEEWLEAQVNLPAQVSSGTGGVDVWSTTALEVSGDTRWWLDTGDTWWGSSGAAESLTGMTPIVAIDPQYVIDQYATTLRGQTLTIGTGEDEPLRIVHRITARGVGGNENVAVLLQSTYVRPYD